MQQVVRGVAAQITKDVSGALQAAHNMLRNVGGFIWEVTQAISAILWEVGKYSLIVLLAIVIAVLWAITYPIHGGRWAPI